MQELGWFMQCTNRWIRHTPRVDMGAGLHGADRYAPASEHVHASTHAFDRPRCKYGASCV